jgi:hypothetical protein
MALHDLLSKESIAARLIPGMGPMPVFNASCPPENPLAIRGLTAEILHGVGAGGCCLPRRRMSLNTINEGSLFDG